MRILFVSSLHHPEALRQAQVAARKGGTPPPLFPPSMSQHFWEKALRKRGHTLDVFYRNLPNGQPNVHDTAQTQRHQQGWTARKLVNAALSRVPPTARPDLRARNRELLARVRTFGPDVLWMTGDNTVIYPETLAVIKRSTGCTLVYACGTSPIVFSHAIDRAAARLYDLVLANDYYHGIQWQELGVPKMVALPLAACDPDFHHPYSLTDEERVSLACDVAFVGTLIPDHLYSRRVRALEAISAAGFDLGIWSVHDVPASLQKHLRGAALGEQMEKILGASKLCFNTHGDFMLYGGNLRLFEVAGAGVCQITDDLPGTRLWFPPTSEGDLLITYSTMDDLCAKVAHLLAHDDERDAMAKRAQAHVYAHHTYDHRAATFEALIADVPAVVR